MLRKLNKRSAERVSPAAFCIGAALAALLASSAPAASQNAPALDALDTVIAEIRERYLGETPRPAVGNNPCDMRPDELIAAYIDVFETHEELYATMEEVADVERRANTAIREGDFCDRKIVQEQARGVEVARALDLDGVLVAAQDIAACAPVLLQRAQLGLTSARSPAQLAQINQTIDRMRDISGDALQIAGKMAFARDMRSKVIETMEGNLVVCR